MPLQPVAEASAAAVEAIVPPSVDRRINMPMVGRRTKERQLR